MEKRKIVFATGNRGKLREASEILGEGFELFTPMDFGLTDDIPETGTTLEENSLQKAEFIFERKGCDCFADDTGLEVEALGGAPGVYTARYAGEGKDFGKNMDKVLSELEALEGQDPKTTRRARFRSVVTLILDGEVHQPAGEASGMIRYSFPTSILDSPPPTSPKSRRTRYPTEARPSAPWPPSLITHEIQGGAHSLEPHQVRRELDRAPHIEF